MGLYKNIALFLSFEETFLNEKYITCIGEIVSIKKEKEYVDQYTLKIKECDENYNVKDKKIFIYIEKNFQLSPGDMIKISGTVKRAEEATNFFRI